MQPDCHPGFLPDIFRVPGGVDPAGDKSEKTIRIALV